MQTVQSRMPAIQHSQLKLLMEAVRTVHAHHESPFPQRLIRALKLLFPNSTHALEIFGKDGSYSVESDVPFDAKRMLEIQQRLIELVPAENPMYPVMLAGETSPMRLSDFITVRQLRRTNLYQEIFRDIDVTRQIGIPIQSEHCLGGITINRGGKDFTPEDLTLAALLTPQIVTAFETDRLLTKLRPAIASAPTIDLIELRRLGLSRRESEVFCWIAEGKRDGEIAIILDISVRTVNQHVYNILRKLRVETRTAAVAMVVQRTSLPPPDGLILT